MIVYCRAVDTQIAEKFPAVADALAARSSRPTELYVWTDLSLTTTPFPDGDVFLSAAALRDAAGWGRFCAEHLGIAGAPADLDQP